MVKAPWIDRQDLGKPQEPLPMAPVRNLRDFQIQRGQQAPWMQGMVESIKQASPVGEKDTTAQDFDMQVFISAGMPDGVLRTLFSQAMEFPRGRVRFVLRGFAPQKIGSLIGRLRSLFPDRESDHIVIDIDPNAFRAYGVDTVPVYLVKERVASGDKWFEVKGAQGLHAAKENVARRSKAVMGELYAIAEPDAISLFEERAKAFDWQPVMQRAQARAAKNLKPSFDLPTATKDAVAYFVPTFTVPENIETPSKDGKGKVLLARAGQVFNLLDHARLQVPMIVFDPGDPRQSKMVKQWLKDPMYVNADLFIVGTGLKAIDEKTPVTIEIAKAFNRPVYPLFARLSERFGVEAVPSIVEQEGRQLRISIFAPKGF